MLNEKIYNEYLKSIEKTDIAYYTDDENLDEFYKMQSAYFNLYNLLSENVNKIFIENENDYLLKLLKEHDVNYIIIYHSDNIEIKLNTCYKSYTLRELSKDLQGLLKEMVSIVCIYKINKSWYYYILDFEDQEDKILNYFSKIDSKAFILNPYNSMVSFDLKSIQYHIKNSYYEL
jgi:hypothetical protein